MTTASKPAPARIVRLEETRRRLLWVIAGSMVLVGGGTSAGLVWATSAFTDMVALAIALIPVTATLIAAGALVTQVERIRLLVTDQGLEYRALGAFVRAPWEDILGLGTVVHGPLSGEGIRLGPGAESRTSPVLAMVGMEGPVGGIPLTPFVVPLQGSWLHDELRRRVAGLDGAPLSAPDRTPPALSDID